MAAATRTREIFSYLDHKVSETSSGAKVHSYYSDLADRSPILILIHGYPQSAFIWRHVAVALKGKISLFVPEIPGYGISAPGQEPNKKAIGGALIEALVDCFQLSKDISRVAAVCAHDRGARVAHRIIVDKDDFPQLRIQGAILIDITPSKAQWDLFTTPAIATAYFHWPLLSNAELATEIILGFGTERWLKEICFRLIGPNQSGRERFEADNAVAIYQELFSKRETIWHTCLDYKSGGVEDYALQAEDQKNGKKISVPTFIVFSEWAWGRRQDVGGIWKDWVAEGVPLEVIGVGDDYGHYLPEEAPEEVLAAIRKLLEHVQ